ncbi:hypothetical protein [Mucilaginibacter terrae]|uniref:NCAIR mutase (PurE)-related protein n=1 Tax=Mucilaginibacter terrae TaxID=1955052 RepID=A0ABU3GVD4_9SPHI|nr:hypothetical protein [Mucilaginibacter terrae]MDT3403738.1 NCAIR mutase (PurE)-related protein [Mucilaginibacter terrae]
MKKLFIIVLPLLLMITVKEGYGQKSQQQDAQQLRKQQLRQDSSMRRQRQYYRQSLHVDSVKAQQVSQVQDEYKAGLNAVMADAGLNEEQKKQKIKTLMQEKNRKLKSMLTPEQQAKIIPSTERTPEKP